jgi:DNA invertase Pin-like site-specific DNA recombinase
MQALSIEGQRQTCVAYAGAHGCMIAETFIEHQSAKSPGRPVFAEMLRRIKDGEADAILSYHPNRLSRNSRDGGELIYWLDVGILKDLRFPVFWFENTPQGKSILGIEFAQSKRYSDDLAVVTARGLEQKIRRGEYPGIAPRGYLNDRRTKTIKVDPIIGPIIAEMFEKYATGHETIDTMRRFLFSRGVASKPLHGYPGGLPIHQEILRRILRNPIYYGAFRIKGVLYEGKHTPLVSKRVFDAVQRVLEVRTPTRKQVGPAQAFNRLVRCAHCHMSITSEIQKGHLYYRCTRKSQKLPCNAPYVRSEVFEAQLSGLVSGYHLPDEVGQELQRDLEQCAREAEAHVGEAKERHRERLTYVSRKLQLLTETYLDGHIDRPTFVTKQNELQSLKASIKADTASLELSSCAWLEPARKWINTAQQVGKNAKNCSRLELRGLALEIFGSNLSLDGQKLSGVALKPWDALLVFNQSKHVVPLRDAVRTAFGVPPHRDGDLLHPTTAGQQSAA